MAIGEIDTRTTEEIIKDLEHRRKGYKFLTTEEALSWNKERGLAPLSKKHWSVKAAKVAHVLRMGGAWKRLAKALYTEMVEIKKTFKQVEDALRAQDAHIQHLSRMMIYCNKCSAGPGEECGFRCSRDGSRDT